jgi:serine-type D-Ala-D-Ala carboxypeptidase/endopeptidase
VHRSTRWAFPAFITFVLSAGAYAAAADMTPASPEQIQSALDAYTAGFHGSAVVVGVVEGESVKTYASGDLGPGRPRLGDTTIFQIGSVTKTFTATLLAAMILDGEVRLNGPIQTYLPPGVRAPSYSGKPIVLENLAAQNSGLPRLPTNLHPSNPNDPYADYTPALLWQFLSSYTLSRAPGVAYEYSNLGVGLLGDLLARRAGEPYGALLARRVTDPLQMRDTTLVLSPAQRDRLAPGYSVDGHPQPPWRMGALEAAGGLFSDVRDMLQYLQANLAASGGSLGSAMALAQTPRAPDDSPNGTTRVGFVWLTNVANGNAFMNGETGGYHAFIAFNRANRVGVVVLANVADPNVDALALHLVYPQLVAAPSPPGVSEGKEDAAVTARAKDWLHQLQTGAADRSRLTPDFAARLTPQFVRQVREELAPLGEPTSWTYIGSQTQAGVTLYRYRIVLAGTPHEWTIGLTADGKLAGSFLR